MAGNAKELRLGLVCYGGSSLAIYMHGITKEIHRLVKASALRAGGAGTDAPSEQVYIDLLTKLSEEANVDLRVLVDVIAGTSAGGINGIFLAKALAGNRSQDALRDLWFVRGDMQELVVGPRKILGVRIPWKLKVPFLLRRAAKRSVLRGDDMSRWLYSALEQMDRDAAPPGSPASLLPAAHPLDLFVTITDFYGYERLVPLLRPRFAPDSRHRHALNFRYVSPDSNQLSDNPGLAFAARTTSCFPAVFPPVNPEKFGQAIGASVAPLLDRSFRIYPLSRADPNKTYFIDGGVLDNKPFSWVIDTIIHRRPAESEVLRRLLYIEPDPAQFATTQGGKDPETIPAALGALTTIPRSEPILDDLLLVQKHNEQVARIRDVIEANFARVAGLVGQHVSLETLQTQPPAQWPWTTWNQGVHKEAIDNAGMAYATYMRLKISNVVDGFARSVCAICNYPDDSNHAFLVRGAVRAWAREAGLLEGLGRGRDTKADPCADEDLEPRAEGPFRPTDQQVRFLRAFDLGYMRRRLRFVIAAFDWWYRCVGREGFPSREDLDAGKGILYDGIAELDALAVLSVADAAGQADAKLLSEQVLAAFPQTGISEFLDEFGADGTHYATERLEQLNALLANAEAFFRPRVEGFAPKLLGRLAELTKSWDPKRMRDLVVRYLGFPIWDVLLYPIQSLSQVGEGDRVEVARVSPREAALLQTPAGGKVEGAKFHHFYAFFSREARENDYLWGRLDASEQLIRLLVESGGSSESVPGWSQRVFRAILDEEAGALTTIKGKVAALRTEVDGLDVSG